MQFIYKFNCIADEILAHSYPAEECIEDIDMDLLHQTKMEWQGNASGIQSLYQFGSSEIEFIDEEMEEVAPSNVETDCTPIDSSQRKVATKKKREVHGPYRKYNSQQIQQLFDYGGYLILLIRLIFFLKFQIIFRMNDFILY